MVVAKSLSVCIKELALNITCPRPVSVLEKLPTKYSPMVAPKTTIALDIFTPVRIRGVADGI